MIDKHEMLFVVDENNKPIDPLPRHEVHSNHYWHRTAHIWVVNSQGQVLVQKRSLFKDSSPGKWEAFFGGHLEPEVEYVDSAVREIQEELGLQVKPEELGFFKINKAENSYEFQGVYIYHWDGNIKELEFEKDEIDHLEWRSIDDLYEILVNKKNSDWTEMGYEKEILDFLSAR